MFGPGAYRPDPTEGITTIADLPPPEIVPSSRTYTRQACPRCRHQAYRDKQCQRTLHDLGNLDLWCPRELVVTFLDDKLLPSTSNAVERGNRRYRKMQKSVYRVRTQAQIRARLALDMWREA